LAHDVSGFVGAPIRAGQQDVKGPLLLTPSDRLPVIRSCGSRAATAACPWNGQRMARQSAHATGHPVSLRADDVSCSSVPRLASTPFKWSRSGARR
jgi:hypothetical protein